MRSGTTVLLAILLSVLPVGVACSTDSASPSVTATAAGSPQSDAMVASPIQLEFPAALVPDVTVKHQLGDGAPREIWEPADGMALYTVATGESTQLEDGALGAFSPGSRTVAWSDGSNLRVRELNTGAEEEYPVGGVINGYVSDAEVLLSLNSGRVILKLTDGTSAPTTEGPFALIPLARAGSTRLFTDTPPTSPGPKMFTVIRPSASLLELSGVFAAALADDQTLVVAVPATDETRLINLVLVDLPSASTELLLSIDVGEVVNELQIQLPLGAANGRVAWTKRYCEADPQIQFMDLEERTIHSTDLQGWVSVTPDRRLAIGDGFNTARLVDPDAGTAILDVRPPDGSGIRWDATYQWVLAGPEQGHGTACPGS